MASVHDDRTDSKMCYVVYWLMEPSSNRIYIYRGPSGRPAGTFAIGEADKLGLSDAVKLVEELDNDSKIDAKFMPILPFMIGQTVKCI